jgi:hypothetical protein
MQKICGTCYVCQSSLSSVFGPPVPYRPLQTQNKASFLALNDRDKRGGIEFRPVSLTNLRKV